MDKIIVGPVLNAIGKLFSIHVFMELLKPVNAYLEIIDTDFLPYNADFMFD
jgi:hypothetical protein